jgi:TolA-binding protein
MMEPERDPVDELAASLRRLDARLPDTNRERGAQTLVERLKSNGPMPDVRAPARGRAITPVAWALGGALAAAAILLGWIELRAPSPTAGRAPSPPRATPAPPAAATPAPEVPAPRAILRVVPRTLTPAPSARLTAQAGEDVTAWLAECGRLVLRGSGVVAVEEDTRAGIILGLGRGTLAVSFDHRCHRGLRVRTKDALVEVTGTVFAVRADDGPTHVSVSSGSVVVETETRAVTVPRGKSWKVGARGLTAPDPETALAMRLVQLPEKPRPPLATAPRVTGSAAPRSAAIAPPAEAATPGGDAEALYRAAEQALAQGRAAAATRQLRTLVEQYPAHALAGPATYELGRLAFEARDFGTARAHFAEVRASPQPEAARFREPAAYFVCRSDQELGKTGAAIACFERYRRDFRGSPHAGDALAALAGLYLATRDCANALPVLQAYLEHCPRGPQAEAMRAARDGCTAGAP